MSKQTDLINIPDAITVDGNTIYVDSNGQDAGYNPLQIGNTSNSNTITSSDLPAVYLWQGRLAPLSGGLANREYCHLAERQFLPHAPPLSQ